MMLLIPALQAMLFKRSGGWAERCMRKIIMLENKFLQLDEQKILDDAELCAKNLTSNL